MDYQPTGRDRHIERVTGRIEGLRSAQYWCTEASIPSPHTDDEGRDGYWRGVTSDGSGWDHWDNLTVGEKEQVLRHHVDWEGFARAQIKDVIDKVIRDEPAQRWMDSVRYPASPPADVPAEPSHPTPSPWPGATEQDRIDAWERFRDVDSSGLTRAERDLYYHELGGGGSTTYELWTPDGERGDFPAGYSVVMTFQAADSENAADMAKETFFDLASGVVLTDTTGDAYRFDGDTFHQFKPEPSPPLADKPLNVASDVYTALMTHLESAADEFARLASTSEQAAFAKGFADFVAGDAQTSLRYLTGLAVAANRPDAMAKPPSPGEIAAGHDATAPRRGEYRVWHDTAWPENTIHDIAATVDKALSVVEAEPSPPLPAPPHPGLSPSRDEIEAVVAAAMDGGFNRPAEPGRPTRPGPEETPLERVERQIGHIKLRPDPYDFSIEELGPWDSGVSDEWKRLPEAEKLSRLDRQVDWRDISPEDKQRLLGREVDLGRVPADPPRRGQYRAYDDAARDDAQAELVRDFGARIGGLIREGVPDFPPLGHTLPWEQATEGRKLANIVWESMALHPFAGRAGMIALPGAVALEAVERHVDYAGLPAVQRQLLTELRSRLDAGQFAGTPPGDKDPVADGLGRAVGIADLEEMLASWKEDGDRPWAAWPEDEKVRVIVVHAHEAAVPGAYTLAVIGREVDDAGLPPWRREALEGLRARIDGGEFDGAGRGLLDPDDRLDRALRLAELEARVEDEKRLGAPDRDGKRWPWGELTEEQKLGEIELEIAGLHLATEPRAYEVAAREVDLTRVPEARRRAFEESREEAEWIGERGASDVPSGVRRLDAVADRERRATGDLARAPEEARTKSPGEAAAGHDGTAAGRGGDRGRHFLDDARALLDRFRGAAGRIFGREISPPPSPGDIAEQGGPGPPPSLTAAVLDNPNSFLPDSGPGNGNDQDHDNGPDRGR